MLDTVRLVQPAPDKSKPPPRDFYQSEALVALALAVGIGIFAVPLEIATPLRFLIAVAAFVLSMYVFGRFPAISRALVAFFRKVGLVVFSLLILSILGLLFGPTIIAWVSTIEISPEAAATLTRCATGAAGGVVIDFLRLQQNWSKAYQYQPRTNAPPPQMPSPSRLFAGTAFAAIFGIAGVLLAGSLSAQSPRSPVVAYLFIGAGFAALVQLWLSPFNRTLNKWRRDIEE